LIGSSDRFDEEYELLILDSYSEVLDPPALNYCIFSSKNHTFFIIPHQNFEVEQIAFHQPALFLYLLDVLHNIQCKFFLHFSGKLRDNALVFKGVKQ